MINVNQITAQMARMSDQALQQFAAMHKNDPYTLSLALSESNRRKQLRQGAQMQQQPQPKVVDQEVAEMAAPQALPEEIGIGQLPAPNMQRMATGGIVAFDEGGEVPGYDSGGVTKLTPMQLFEKALDREGVQNPVERAFAKSIYLQESGGGKNTGTSNRGAVGGMQITPNTFKSVADKDMDINNPFDNMRAGIRYARQGFAAAEGNTNLAGAYYYGGPGGLDKAKKGIAVSDPKNPNAPDTLQYAKQVAARMPVLTGSAAMAATPSDAGLVSLIPGQSGAVPEPAKTRPLTGNERLIGGAETALQYGTGLLAIPTAGAYSLYRKAMYGEDPTKNFEKYASQVTYEPRSSGGPEMSQGFAQTLSDLKLPPYLAHLGVQAPRSAAGINALTKEQRVAMAADAAARAAELKKQTELTRLEAPKPVMGATGEPMVQTEKGIMPKRSYDAAEQLWRDRQQSNYADKFAKQLAELAEKAPEDAPAVPAVKEPMVAERARAVAASQAAPGFNQETNDFNMGKNLTPLLPGEFGEDTGQMPVEKPSTKEIKEIGKEATPKSERKGMSGEDFLMIGLGILSGQSPYAMTNIGEGGLKGLQMVQAGRKSESEAAYRDAMSKYYTAGAEAIERGAKEKDLVGAAEKAAHDAFTALAKDNVFLMTNPEERAKLYNRLRMEKFMQYGISPTMLGSGPSAGGQPRFLGFEKASPE